MLGHASRGRVDWLTPNESEATALTGIPVSNHHTGLAAARLIQERFTSTGVVVTLGAQGAVAIDRQGTTHVADPHLVNAVDSTAAGDTFSVAFALSIASGESITQALAFASAAGALSTTRVGAVPSIPTLTQVRALVNGGVTA